MVGSFKINEPIGVDKIQIVKTLIAIYLEIAKRSRKDKI